VLEFVYIAGQVDSNSSEAQNWRYPLNTKLSKDTLLESKNIEKSFTINKTTCSLSSKLEKKFD
jgi:hypothetical protein